MFLFLAKLWRLEAEKLKSFVMCIFWLGDQGTEAAEFSHSTLIPLLISRLLPSLTVITFLVQDKIVSDIRQDPSTLQSVF